MEAQTADTIFVGGTIVTVNDAQPQAEAVAVADGLIVAVGTRAEIEALASDSTDVVDLGGYTMIPGFVDAHSHFINALAMSTQANISAPPVGPCDTAEEIVAVLKQFAADRQVPPGELLIGYGYDENNLPPDHPLTRDDLDSVFPDNPVLAMHVSLHGAVMNSAAFEKYGIGPDTETPPGGVIVRREGSTEPLGLVMETAFLPVFSALPVPGPDEELEQLRSGQMIYAAAGVTTAQEGATHVAQLDVLERGAEAGALFIDVVAYPFITDMEKILATHPVETFGSYSAGLKLGGIKITMDGSPQGRTAYFTSPYLTGGPGGEENWCGEPTFPQEVFNEALKTCYDNGLQVLFHANGDAAIDMILAGHEFAAAGHLDDDRRSTVIHSQFVRPDQLKKYRQYNLLPSLYTEHTFFFADAHIANRGIEQASYISPLRDALDLGLPATNHTDFNVAPIDHLMVLWTAVNRTTRSGEVLGPDQRVTPYEALKCVTINSARQHFEEGSKGSIEVGKRADLVVLSDNPLAVDPLVIKDIRVLKTIKDGVTIFEASSDGPQA